MYNLQGFWVSMSIEEHNKAKTTEYSNLNTVFFQGHTIFASLFLLLLDIMLLIILQNVNVKDITRFKNCFLYLALKTL